MVDLPAGRPQVVTYRLRDRRTSARRARRPRPGPAPRVRAARRAARVSRYRSAAPMSSAWRCLAMACMRSGCCDMMASCGRRSCWQERRAARPLRTSVPGTEPTTERLRIPPIATACPWPVVTRPGSAVRKTTAPPVTARIRSSTATRDLLSTPSRCPLCRSWLRSPKGSRSSLMRIWLTSPGCGRPARSARRPGHVGQDAPGQ
jgi:hypothetical protein